MTLKEAFATFPPETVLVNTFNSERRTAEKWMDAALSNPFNDYEVRTEGIGQKGTEWCYFKVFTE